MHKKNKFCGPYAVLETAKYYDQDGRVDYYLDLHAHTNKPSAFLFYNKTTDTKANIDILVMLYMLHISFFLI